jgi:hypothetical protein
MGEVIRFVSKSERERIRLIQEAARTTTVSSRRLITSAMNPQLIRSMAPMLIAAMAFCRDQDHRRAPESVCSGELPRADRHHLGFR